MEMREIGNSGIHVSVMGLGCNNFGFSGDVEQARSCIHQALDCGMNFFDMASEHGEEETLVGTALAGRRHEAVIATKVGNPEVLAIDRHGPTFKDNPNREGLSRRWIMESVEESLRRLRTDYIDLYQPHTMDDTVPRDETLRAFDDLVRQGKVRAIGEAATRGHAALLARSREIAAAEGLAGQVSMQARYNLLDRSIEAELLPAIRKTPLSLIPFSPLENGMLSGKYRSGSAPPPGSRFDKLAFIGPMSATPEKFARLAKLEVFAESRERSILDLAIGWLLSEPRVASVIAGATSPEQVRRNAHAAGKRLSPADRAELDALA